jgi:hypothetical protein
MNLKLSRISGGQIIRKRSATLMAAAEEVAAEKGGKVIFCCPNYAVVGTPDGEELYIWMK